MLNPLTKLGSTFRAMAAVFLFTGVAASAQAITYKQVEVHIGIYAPFSDEHAFIGRNILGAMELAREQTPNQNINYTFYTLDRSSATPTSADTLNKFIHVHHINVLVTEGKDSGLMAAPVARQNSILHFSLTNEPAIADGKNNYLAWNSAYEHSALLANEVKPEFIAQYLEMYQSHPVTEAGHAYDVFQIIHNSTLMAMNSKNDFFKQSSFENVQILAAGTGLMGALNMDKKGVVYAQNEIITSMG